LRIVLDTNLIVSALITPGGVPSQLIDLWISGAFDLMVSHATLDELNEVMARKRFASIRRTRAKLIDNFLEQVSNHPRLVKEIPAIPIYERDPKDTKILALAMAGKADAIVSGDKDLLVLGSYEGIPILSARAFLEMLNGTADA